jgi:hypothetical protein
VTTVPALIVVCFGAFHAAIAEALPPAMRPCGDTRRPYEREYGASMLYLGPDGWDTGAVLGASPQASLDVSGSR